MSLNTKLEIALEIMSTKIAEMAKKGINVEDEEMKILLEEREKMYQNDEKVIDKIIEIYGKEIKNVES